MFRDQPPPQLINFRRGPSLHLNLASRIKDQRLFRFCLFGHRAALRCPFACFLFPFGCAGGGGGGGSAGSPASNRRYFITFLLCSSSVALKKWPPCVLATK